MNKKPLVSVIVPNYNYARFLEQRMETLLCQTYKNIEVILLDDASTDESLEIIKLYQHNSRVSHVEINTCNSGTPFIQWANGLALARGKYVWIAESDDYSELSFLDMVVPLMEENEDAALCLWEASVWMNLGIKLGLIMIDGEKTVFLQKGYKVLMEMIISCIICIGAVIYTMQVGSFLDVILRRRWIRQNIVL